MYALDPARIDLAEEYRCQPNGRHSGDLQRLINMFRSAPFAGKYVLIRESRTWPLKLKLGRFGATPQDPVTLTGIEFDTYDAAEWAVVKLRWKDHTGQDLPFD
jgi:hypothetical protein